MTNYRRRETMLTQVWCAPAVLPDDIERLVRRMPSWLVEELLLKALRFESCKARYDEDDDVLIVRVCDEDITSNTVIAMVGDELTVFTKEGFDAQFEAMPETRTL